MSVPKGKRTTSEVKYFDFAYTVVEKLTKYLLRDFGIKKTYRDLKFFIHKTKMDPVDAETLDMLREKYKIDVEASYPMWLMEYYRDTMLRMMTELIRNISMAHTIFPNSMYEYNVKRQYQTDAIANCYDLKHTLQLAIKIIKNTNIDVYIPFIRDIDEEIGYLKTWRKDTTKFKKICSDKDARARLISEKKVENEIKNNSKDKTFLERVLNLNQELTRKTLIDNLEHTECYYGEDGRLYSKLYIPALIMYEDKEMTIIKSIGIDKW